VVDEKDSNEQEDHIIHLAFRRRKEGSTLSKEEEDLIRRAQARSQPAVRSDASFWEDYLIKRHMHTDRPLPEAHIPGKLLWVRMRRALGKKKQYGNDLALAVTTEDPSLMNFWLIPRWKCKGTKNRYQQVLLDPAWAHKFFGSKLCKVEEGHSHWILNGSKFSKTGFLLMSGPIKWTLACGGEVIPTYEEYKKFQTCEMITEEFRAKTISNIESHQLQLGDRVKFLYGSLCGLLGTVRETTTDHVVIDVPALDIRYTAIPHEIRKYFRVGDRVRIASGDRQGVTGWIINVTLDNNVEVVDSMLQSTVRIIVCYAKK